MGDRLQARECLDEALSPGTSSPTGRLLVRMAGIEAEATASLRKHIELKITLNAPGGALVVGPPRCALDQQASDHMGRWRLIEVNARLPAHGGGPAVRSDDEARSYLPPRTIQKSDRRSFACLHLHIRGAPH